MRSVDEFVFFSHHCFHLNIFVFFIVFRFFCLFVYFFKVVSPRITLFLIFHTVYVSLFPASFSLFSLFLILFHILFIIFVSWKIFFKFVLASL